MHQVVKRGTEDKAIDYVFKLLDIPWWYYAIAVLLGAAAWRLWKRPSLGMLIGYAFLILAETVLIRKPFQEEHIKLELFWSWRVWSVQQNQILAKCDHVRSGWCVGWLGLALRGLWFAAGLSVGIEILQLVTTRDLCEYDDFIHNMFGAVIGTGVMLLYLKKRGGAKKLQEYSSMLWMK